MFTTTVQEVDNNCTKTGLRLDEIWNKSGPLVTLEMISIFHFDRQAP